MKSIVEIVETLILNGTLTDTPGLFYGKTGIAVFFFYYARQTGNELYQDYAMNLIEEIQEQITVTSSARYDTGIAGIGVGFEYFLQNGFLSADEDIFEDFDARMFRAALYEPYPDLRLEGGLTGWGRYFIYRLRGKGQKNDKLLKALSYIANEIARKIKKKTVLENEQPDVYRFLYDLISLHEYVEKYNNTIQKCREWPRISKPDVQKIFPYMNNLQRLLVCQSYFNMDLTEEIKREWKKWEETDDTLMDMGLLKGMSSNGLLHLTKLDENIATWFNLL